MSIDAVIRIAFAMAFLFIIVPALARPRRKTETFLEGFFWNFAIGIALITLVGQLFSLANLFSFLTLLMSAALVILLGQAIDRGQAPWSLVRRSSENAFLALLNIFDGRVNVRRRVRRAYRRAIATLRQKTEPRLVRLQIAGWTALTVIAAALRFYRPLASANLGFSDTYVHLYLVKLLEDGRQVDPAWGPYPRGMHFLLMAIHELTNVDEILLMNFFGAFVGVLITLAVADTTRRLSKSLVAGLLAGFFFATLVGGPGQYFVLRGAFATNDSSLAATLRALPYRQLTREAGEFDLALTAFQRQTSTLPQELAIVLLFPAAMFLLEFFRKRDPWHLLGFAGCTAAIAAVHSGVVVPLVLMSALMLMAAWVHRSVSVRSVRAAVIAGFFAVLVGSAWVLGFIAFPYAGGKGALSAETSVPGSALYYFPFLRKLAGEQATEIVGTRVFVSLTPLLMILIVAAVALAIASFIRRDDLRVNRLWIPMVFLLFLLIHFASVLQFPQIVETTRNSQWLLMSLIILAGVAIAEIPMWSATRSRATSAASASVLFLLLIVWTSRVPRLTDPAIHDRIVNYSGYGGTAVAVLNIERTLEPYTWTIVSYGQEFPMVLRRGFHIPAADFLERYDPGADVIPIPTPHIFVVVEKKPHQFEINTWAQRFSRSDLEERLQTWIHLYQVSHTNLRVFHEDDDVRVYEIERTPAEIEKMSKQAKQ
ncbi:MAG TPA: hypothetical protein VGK04_07215 [Thermoanaerobaculia bacterium]